MAAAATRARMIRLDDEAGVARSVPIRDTAESPLRVNARNHSEVFWQ
jgi:hypothetical protein